MYTSLVNYQIIIALLKKNNIKHMVLSAGSRNIPFVQSVETDSFFKCYSVVDERSAAYFAMGLSLELDEPVVISCTSSTATCNYYPAITESFYLGVPLIVVTSDRNPAYLGQREDQMILQTNMYEKICKKSVQVPIVNTSDDFWHCQRLVNEALLETNHHGKGPVHINVSMLDYASACTESKLPNVVAIKRYEAAKDAAEWKSCAQKLKDAKRIMVICGQNNRVSSELNVALSTFFKKYNCVILAEYMANVECEDVINPFLGFEALLINDDAFEQFSPDLVISFGGNIMSGLKARLRNQAGKYEHWSIEEGGKIVDMFKSLHNIFECKPEYFFNYFLQHADENQANDQHYYEQIKKHIDALIIPEFEFSNAYVVRKLAPKIPANSILHLSINNSIRLVNYFGLQARNIKVYANIGTFGIDGCLSSFVGQAVAAVGNHLSFLIIGDLSFFYDMNAMRIKHMPKTARILMINNHGGGEFYYNMGKKLDPTLDLHTTARHNIEAKGWVESIGFIYLSARNASEYKQNLPKFLTVESESPIFMEVFTEMETDANETHRLHKMNQAETAKESIIRAGKDLIKSVIGQQTVSKLKRSLGKK